MSTIVGNRKILKADFSVEEMAALESAGEKRKYFILRYFVPVAVTLWQEGLAGDISNEWMTLHILRNDSYPDPIYYPVITAAREADRKLLLPNGELWFTPDTYLEDPYTKCVPGVSPHELSRELTKAFGECFKNGSLEDRPMRSNAPLVATIKRTENLAGGTSLALNILVKTRAQAGQEDLLYNQGHVRNAPAILAASEKYQRAYNRLTGSWLALCEDGVGCEECDSLRKSVAANNAYDDPELY